MDGRRSVRVTIGILGVGVLLLATVAPWAQADLGLIAKGEKVYADKKCSICHMVKGKGGKAGPDLSAVGATREASSLKQFMKDPKATNPKAKMMPFKGSEEELEALAAYLMSLK